ncbi:MAG: ankyrin repeat domain-containing protein [Akkermansia sp.]|nr:ankyrin repeat domain-containing protein [Akkermansia sp.]
MNQPLYHKALVLVACFLASCACPDSFRDVPAPQVRQAADVERVTACQMRHYGATLLARAESAAVVRALVQKGADVRGRIILGGKDYPGNPLLQAEKTDVLQELVRCGADTNARGGAKGETPLCAAVRHGQVSKARFLLESGADASLADSQSETPLYIAAMRGDAEMCKLLLGAGAQVDAGEKVEGTAPLLAVLSAAHAGKLVRAEADTIALLLLNAGAQASPTDAEGNTLLHFASPAVVHRLLAAGVSPHATNHLGRTPLFTSCDRVVVDALLGAGADIQARDGEGNSAFDVVSSPQVKSYLLFRGCRSGHAL